MNEVLYTNIFFTITAVASIAVTILVCILLVYAIRIARNTHHMSHLLKEESEHFIEHIAGVRKSILGRIADKLTSRLDDERDNKMTKIIDILSQVISVGATLNNVFNGRTNTHTSRSRDTYTKKSNKNKGSRTRSEVEFSE